MIIYSPFFKPIFWVVMGLIYALMIAGVPVWAEDLGLQMSWWKWALCALWYVLLSFTFAGSSTLLGEKEPQAWYKFLVFHLILTVIAGVLLFCIFSLT